MQTNEFKKSLFGLDSKAVFSYLDTLARDLENKLRSKDDDIKKLKKELSDTKYSLEACQIEYNAFKEASKNEFDVYVQNSKIELRTNQEIARKSYDALSDKYNSLLAEYTNEAGKISGAILKAENAAEEIISTASFKSDEITNLAKIEAEKILTEATKKAEIELEVFRKTKADVSDFTYDVKRLLEKLTSDIKDKIDD